MLADAIPLLRPTSHCRGQSDPWDADLVLHQPGEGIEFAFRRAVVAGFASVKAVKQAVSARICGYSAAICSKFTLPFKCYIYRWPGDVRLYSSNLVLHEQDCKRFLANKGSFPSSASGHVGPP